MGGEVIWRGVKSANLGYSCDASLHFIQQVSKMTNTPSDQMNKLSPESYAGYGNEDASRWMATRTAEKQAAFFLPHLRAGMELLDCGCGPGTITVGLAHRVVPGQCVGIDIDATQVELARTHAASQGISNLRFEAATIYQLPFADASFDAVYSNTVLGWLDDPLAALREIYRVLRVGGVVGIRSGDSDGSLFTPTNPLLERFWTLFDAMIRQSGGNPLLGREHRSLLRQAGFVKVVASATYEAYGTEEHTRLWGQTLSKFLATESQFKQFIQLGSELSEIEAMRQAWLAWSEEPDAFFADVRCEAVGWKQ
jgi:ubiquinone/menaquinone biosynthesis C-methylase UbiE